MNPLFHDNFSISDSLKFVRKSVLIYETIVLAVGKIVEKIERLERKKEDEEHNNTSKNDRR